MQRPPQRAPAKSFDRRLLIPASLFLILAVWVFWPSRYARVKNLDSRGTSIIAYGDSLTAGYGANAGEDYPSQLAKRLGVDVVNAGVSGDTTESALARIDADVLARSPRIVIVGLGGNDFLQSVPIARTEANLRTIIERIHGAGAMVVLVGFRFPSLNADYEGMYAKLARDEGCLFVGNVLAGILTDPSLKSDEIHPNARGYALMAERIAPPLAKLIAKANAKR
ncbi:MAG: arylesterase [Acidobacteria bacterium]|nr:arylesterase [Acidobacteriota bacterium]MBV9475323.1 arylesterase [Acidobacteriota bacterium]